MILAPYKKEGSRNNIIYIALCLSVVLCFPQLSLAGDVDALINKLVGKGVLTRADAEEVVKEMQQEENNKQKVETPDAKIPEWIKDTKLFGDLRLRYQYEDREGKESRDRGRYRLRVGFETKVVDTVKIGFRLATGSGDPRSTNQTFTNSFEKPDLKVDYAYAQWHPTDSVIITGGKMNNPLWTPTDLLWDSDITPEGIAAQFPVKATENLDLFFNTGLFVIDENSKGADPYMYVFQPGLAWEFMENGQLKAAVAYYGFNSVEGASLDHSNGTNTMPAGVLLYDYDAFTASGELSFNKVSDFIPYVAVTAEYVVSFDPDENNKGYIGKIAFGHKKVKKLLDWQFGYSYRRLEQDAWLDILPDSDFYGGDTGVQGHEAELKLGLAKNIALGLDYYHTEKIKGADKPEDVFQVDFNFKF